jgi:tetratricopeptide (TPR) repeat protein
MNMKKPAILVLMVIIIGLAYANSLFNSFVWDDFLVIVDNNFIKSWKNFPLIFSNSYLSPFIKKGCCFFVDTSFGSGETSYRPVVTLSYFLDYALWKLNPFGYHLTNLILHIINALLLYLLTNLIIKNKKVALLGSLLFALHPVNSEAVNVISFREDLLTFLFYISSFILYLNLNNYARAKRIYFYIFSLALFCLALFSKETAVTLPLVLILYDCYFINNRREILTRIKSRYIGYFAVLLFYLWVRFFLISNISEPATGYPGGNFYTNLLTMSRVVAMYLKWSIFPVGISAILPNQPYLVSTSLSDGWVLLSIALVVICFIIVIKTYRVSRAASFFLLWFFLTLLPVANILPIANYIASRYLYLPVAGFCFLIAILLNRAVTLRILSGSIVVVLLVFYSAVTFIRNFSWKNNTVFFLEMAEKYPQNSLAHLGLADSFRKSGLLEKSIAEYQAAIRLNPALGEAYNNLGVALGDAGRYPEAVSIFREGLKVAPEYLRLYDNLAVTYTRIAKWEEAKKTWKEALQINPQYKTARDSLQKIKEWGY